MFVPSALAVHDLSFQLDGDVSTHAYSPVNANQVYDWGANTVGDSSTQANPNTNGLFTVTDTGTAPTGTEAVTNNPLLVNHDNVTTNPFAAAKFVRDFESGSSCTLNSLSTTACTADDSTYATGSKDTLGIGNGGWQCNHDNNVNSKIDIMNAYAASFFTSGQNPHHLVYFGLEKNKNNGTNDVGIWLLQGTASCSAPSGHLNFSGQHQNKDVLVVSEFSQGGGVSSIKAFQWAAAASGPLAGDGGCIDSNDNPDPKTGGCNGLPIATSNSDCKTTGGNDSLCATTNANCVSATLACGKDWNKTVATPWLSWDATKGVGRNQIVSPDFFEGGIDLTQAFQSAGETAPSCFSTIVPDTRSSDTVTATLFDFVAAQLGECHSSTVTTPVDATDHTQPPASSIPVDPADSAVTVQDKATITVTGVGSFTGSIAWHICGRTDPSSTATCDSGGVDLGSTTANSSGDFFSPVTTITAAGRYCFRAEFSSTTTGVPPSSDHSAGECFVVAPVQPTLTTQATTGPVDFGSSISDTVSLSGTAHEPGTGGPTGATPSGSINPTTPGGDATGDVTVVAYGPDSCSTVAFTSGAISASGDGSYGGAGSAFEFTPASPGQYVFVAAYAGDSPNTLNIAASACSGAPASEKVTVRTIPTQIATGPFTYPQDSATITSSVAGNLLPAGGTVVFKLFGAAGGNAALDNCTANGATGLVYSETKTSVVPAGGAHQVTGINTNNTSFKIDSSKNGTYYWLVTYAPGDTAHTGRQSACLESTAVTQADDAGPGTLFP